MKKFNYIILSITVLGILSCTKQLKVEPVSVVTSASFWKTPDDANGALNGMYVKLRTSAEIDLFQWGELRSDEITNGTAGTSGFDRLYLNTMDQTSMGAASTAGGSNWLGMYSTINAANLILKYVPDIAFPSEAVKNSTLAQAYAMRAYCYFILAKTWGNLPLRLTPLEEYDPESAQLPRTPVADIFKLVKQDIEQALQLFPNNNFNTGRNTWSKPAVNALKADVYLWTGKRLGGGTADFTTALAAANDVKTADVTLLSSFSSIFDYANKGNKEIIMASRFQNLESKTMFAGFNGWISSFPTGVSQATKDAIGQVGGNNIWTASASARSAFTNDDQRKNASFIEIYTTIGSTTTYYSNVLLKYSGTVVSGARVWASDYILYRYADVLLMIAEAKNALGQSPVAEINQVRQRAYGANYTSHIYVNSTTEQNDVAILNERQLELAFEGKRWWDLIRFGKVFEKVASLKNRPDPDHFLLFPISSTVLSLETKAAQNPGY